MGLGLLHVIVTTYIRSKYSTGHNPCKCARVFFVFTQLKIAENSSIVAEAVLEDKLPDFWPDYRCLYDVQCPEFKNRELRDKAFQELAEKTWNNM